MLEGSSGALLLHQIAHGREISAHLSGSGYLSAEAGYKQPRSSRRAGAEQISAHAGLF